MTIRSYIRPKIYKIGDILDRYIMVVLGVMMICMMCFVMLPYIILKIIQLWFEEKPIVGGLIDAGVFK